MEGIPSNKLPRKVNGLFSYCPPKKYFHVDNQCDLLYYHLITQPIAQTYYNIRKNKCKSDVDVKYRIVTGTGHK